MNQSNGDHTGTATNFQNNSKYEHYEPGSDPLQNVDTATSINVPRDLFEKLYLSPENKVKGDLRKTFGNPTPLYVVTIGTASKYMY